MPGADKARDLGSAAHNMPGFVRHIHFNQDISGKSQFCGNNLFSALRLDHIFRGDQDLPDALTQIVSLDAVHEALRNLALISGVGMNDVPLLRIIHASVSGPRRHGAKNVCHSIPYNEIRHIKEKSEEKHRHNHYECCSGYFTSRRPRYIIKLFPRIFEKIDNIAKRSSHLFEKFFHLPRSANV